MNKIIWTKAIWIKIFNKIKFKNFKSIISLKGKVFRSLIIAKHQNYNNNNNNKKLFLRIISFLVTKQIKIWVFKIYLKILLNWIDILYHRIRIMGILCKVNNKNNILNIFLIQTYKEMKLITISNKAACCNIKNKRFRKVHVYLTLYFLKLLN